MKIKIAFEFFFSPIHVKQDTFQFNKKNYFYLISNEKTNLQSSKNLIFDWFER